MKHGARPEPGGDREVLAGLVERVTFHNPENGFCVLRIKARGHHDLVTAVGHAAMIGAAAYHRRAREQALEHATARDGLALDVFANLPLADFL